MTYNDGTRDPSMTTAIAAAVAAWNAAPTHVLLQASSSQPAVAFVAAVAPTATTTCTAKTVRTSVVITLDSAAWHGTGGKKRIADPETVVARQIGHALGLTGAGGCEALMTKRTCKAVQSAPDPAEATEVDKLYP